MGNQASTRTADDSSALSGRPPRLISATRWYCNSKTVMLALMAVMGEIAACGWAAQEIHKNHYSLALKIVGIALLMAVGMVWFIRWDNKDFGHQVWQAEDRLIFIHGNQKVEIMLSDILNVSYSWTSRYTPSHVELHLSKRCELGVIVKFIPRTEWRSWSWGAPPIVGELQYLAAKFARERTS